MGMIVAGRKVEETVDEIRYEFGWDHRFDRVLTINKQTWQIVATDGDQDPAVGAVVTKIRRAWQERGEFPLGVVFAG